jgi:hypothetical protein
MEQIMQLRVIQNLHKEHMKGKESCDFIIILLRLELITISNFIFNFQFFITCLHQNKVNGNFLDTYFCY